MPISTANMKLYPGGSIKSPEWLAIRERIRARAGDKCEGCGVENGLIGIRMPSGGFLPLGSLYKPGETVFVDWQKILPLPEWKAERLTVIKIVCTTAHLDHGLSDHSDGNLAFWCQKCHNSHDAPDRAKNAAATRRARKPIDLIDLMEVRA